MNEIAGNQSRSLLTIERMQTLNFVPKDKWRESRLRCGFCGHKFQAIGEKFRVVYTNDIEDAWGNPFVCEACSVIGNDALRLEWKNRHDEAKTLKNGRLWWFFDNSGS